MLDRLKWGERVAACGDSTPLVHSCASGYRSSVLGRAAGQFRDEFGNVAKNASDTRSDRHGDGDGFVNLVGGNQESQDGHQSDSYHLENDDHSCHVLTSHIYKGLSIVIP
jgi:hypothetical protein